MPTEKERMQILDMIESGAISAEDGVRLLNAISPEGDQHEPPASLHAQSINLADDHHIEPEVSYPVDSASPDERMFEQDGKDFSAEQVAGQGEAINSTATHPALPQDARKWKNWWVIPFWVGVAIIISGGFLMYTSIENSGIGLSFLCAGIPFIIGVLLLWLGWQSRTAPWLHLRVQQRPGERPQRIAFSLPIPIRLTAWLARTFGSNVEQINDIQLDEMLLAVGETASPDNPIYIQVDEGDEGEKVEIYIG